MLDSILINLLSPVHRRNQRLVSRLNYVFALKLQELLRELSLEETDLVLFVDGIAAIPAAYWVLLVPKQWLAPILS